MKKAKRAAAPQTTAGTVDGFRAEFDAMVDLNCDHRSRWIWSHTVGEWMQVVMASDCDCEQPPAKGSREWIKWREGSLLPPKEASKASARSAPKKGNPHD